MKIPLTESYRREEVAQIFRRVRAGDSCSVVGVSGTAKSNLFRHVISPETRLTFLGPDQSAYLFAPVDTHALVDAGEIALYETILRLLVDDALRLKVEHDTILRVQACHQVIVEVGSQDMATSQRAFFDGLAAFGVLPDLHFVILFDQFDEIYQRVSERFLLNLRALRDRLKYRVSYVVFTREELTQLAQGPAYEEFNELLSAGIIWLGPYNRADAETLIQRIEARYGYTVDGTTLERLIGLTGGHPGLLKAAYQAVAEGRARSEAAKDLLADPDVKTECSKLWGSVSTEEQAVLTQVAAGAEQVKAPNETLKRLERKQLVKLGDDRPTLFCPIFAVYASLLGDATEAPPDKHNPIREDSKGLRVDEAAGTIWLGQQEITNQLTRSEFKLLSYLQKHRGQVCKRDDIIRQVYTEVKSEVGGDNRIDTLVTRLRRKIKKAGGDPNQLVTIHGRGYQWTALD